MWKIKGKLADAERFVPFVAHEVLYEYDGPRIFTLVDTGGELNLIYWSDNNERQDRFVVVPTSATIVASLRTGGASVFDALNQPRCWICDVLHDGNISQCWRVNFEDIPRDALPAVGTLLLPSLEHELIALEGRVRELDKDRRSFELREIKGASPTQRFAFDESLRDQVYHAFDDEVRVKLAGRKIPGKAIALAVALSRAGVEMAQNVQNAQE
jgi:hypothetical protein